jgi:short-chain Z-isoprenyl diphosphate synthase
VNWNQAKRLVKKPLYRVYESRILKFLERDKLPRHIGVIHDGHRRYARAEGLPDYAASYREGMRKFLDFLGWADELEIHAVTCWLLSTENLSRPAEELEPYYDVLITLFRDIPGKIEGHDVAVRFVGSMDLLPQRLTDAAKELEEKCQTGSRRVTIALAYGGRQEIVDAAKELVGSLANDGVAVDAIADRIDAEALGSFMYSADLPDPDLVIRTSGETRLSGFLLWQAAYAEFSFVDVYWPEFRRVDFLRAVRDFTHSNRRYGR